MLSIYDAAAGPLSESCTESVEGTLPQEEEVLCDTTRLCECVLQLAGCLLD